VIVFGLARLHPYSVAIPAGLRFPAQVLISRFDTKADPTALRACFELFDAGQQLDDPIGPPVPDQAFAIKWSEGFDQLPRETWLATEAGRPVGCYLLELPARENRHVAFCLPVVPPALRRRGIGSALLSHCERRARQAGRSVLVAEVRDESAAAAFAAASGARRGNTELRRILDLRDPALADRVAGLAAGAAAAAAGYEVRSWTGLTPDEYLDKVAAVGVAMQDAPTSDSIEHEVWDGRQVSALEQHCLANRRLPFQVAAFHKATGQLAGFSVLVVDGQVPDWGRQHDTLVAREHRGHRLGLHMKISMLDLLARQAPQVERIITANGDRNLHMAAINDQLGFRVCDAVTEWLLDITGS
jgi:GNAT superfamily N-acetyltransferase/RimJ/RimL family protein N-acetyltransferase